MRIRVIRGSGGRVGLLAVGALLGSAGCSSATDETGGGTGGGLPFVAGGGASAGGATPGGGAPATAGGYTGVAGTQGIAGTPGGSGAPPVGAGGAPAAGGGPAGGAAGAGGDGAAGGGGTALVKCDLSTESAAKPNTDNCGELITATGGINMKLGPYGAAMSVNEGKGFENADPADMATCPTFAAIFGEPKATTDQLLDVGPQPCTATAPNTGNCLDFKLYTVYHPVIWPEGKIPVLSWGNGTCAQPEGYGALLRYVASYGFFIVAANNREVGTGKEIKHAIDFAAAANDDPNSPYHGHLDMSKVGVMGHSQGSQGAGAAAADSRVKSVILFNAGNQNAKPYLAVSGELDITGYTGASMASVVNGQPKAAYLYYYKPAGAQTDNLRGHLVLMLQPDRVAPQTVAWWQMILNGDSKAKDNFVGSSCAFCGHSGDYDFGQHGL